MGRIQKAVKKILVGNLPFPSPPPDSRQELNIVIHRYYNPWNPTELQHDLDENVSELFDHIVQINGYPSMLEQIRLFKKDHIKKVMGLKTEFIVTLPLNVKSSLGITTKHWGDVWDSLNTSPFKFAHTSAAKYGKTRNILSFDITLSTDQYVPVSKIQKKFKIKRKPKIRILSWSP